MTLTAAPAIMTFIEISCRSCYRIYPHFCPSQNQSISQIKNELPLKTLLQNVITPCGIELAAETHRRTDRPRAQYCEAGGSLSEPFDLACRLVLREARMQNDYWETSSTSYHAVLNDGILNNTVLDKETRERRCRIHHMFSSRIKVACITVDQYPQHQINLLRFHLETTCATQRIEISKDLHGEGEFLGDKYS